MQGNDVYIYRSLDRIITREEIESEFEKTIKKMELEELKKEHPIRAYFLELGYKLTGKI